MKEIQQSCFPRPIWSDPYDWRDAPPQHPRYLSNSYPLEHPVDRVAAIRLIADTIDTWLLDTP